MNQSKSRQTAMDVFATLGRDLASTTEASAAAQIILNAANTLIGWDAAYLILYDPEIGGVPRPLLTIDTINNEHVEQTNAMPDKPSENMLKAIKQGEFMSLYDGPFEIPAAFSFGDRRKRTLSQMFVPVVSGKRTIGVLSIQSYEVNFYKSEQLSLLKDLASHCAGALERIWAQEALGEFVERLKVLHTAVNEINASLEMERVCQVVHETVSRIMPCNDFVIDGYDGKSNEIIPIFAVEHPNRRVYANRYIADHGLAGEIVRTKKPLLFHTKKEIDGSNIQFEDFSSFEEDPTESILAVPMILHGEIYGMVSAQSYQPNAYAQEDLYLLEVLASHAAIAIENARLFDSIHRLANTDELTGILNRRRFFELTEHEFIKAQQTQIPLSIIMLDVDDFKWFNDRHGHKMGDAVLVLATQTCKTSLRQDDIFARMGGEEFAVALPNTRITDAVEVASRLRSAIQIARFSDQSDLPSLDAPVITVSVGVTEFDHTCKSLDVLLDRADKAMYLSKNSGRNQVQIWNKD
ncbi:MAG: GGDEF domain-containing protein [Anaerolineales bacterium]|uniref:sensor domain-containing diguanylate cyclase n=1 Tax=Candidatus Villigracilis vicinus TaxID=3140679 RepID=UPI0031346F7B|nr:GGDEF domain-containing protein [Anaerolineales bacterium]MBK9781924.1 GGDEF domain-containing protein [Anaerolineales bacterium]